MKVVGRQDEDQRLEVESATAARVAWHVDKFLRPQGFHAAI